MKEIRTTRASETRAHEELPSYDMEYRSPLHVPEHVKKPGYDYYWPARSIRGEATSQVDDLLRKGWTLVPADRFKNVIHNPLNAADAVAKQFVCYKDVILMERPEEFGIREKKAFYAKNENKMRNLRGVTSDTGSFSRISRIGSF